MNRRKFLLGSSALAAAVAVPELPTLKHLPKIPASGHVLVEAESKDLSTGLVRRLYFNGVSRFTEFYDAGVKLQRVKDSPKPGEWSVTREGDIQLGSRPYGVLTADVLGLDLQNYNHEPGELAGAAEPRFRGDRNV